MHFICFNELFKAGDLMSTIMYKQRFKNPSHKDVSFKNVENVRYIGIRHGIMKHVKQELMKYIGTGRVFLGGVFRSMEGKFQS